jgi:hypothetical protein
MENRLPKIDGQPITQAQADLVAAIRKMANDRYDEGGDWIVEAFNTKEILDRFASVADAEAFIAAKVDQFNEIPR